MAGSRRGNAVYPQCGRAEEAARAEALGTEPWGGAWGPLGAGSALAGLEGRLG